MMPATGEQILAPEKPAMADDEVVGKHADIAALELAQGGDFEFHVHARLRREDLAEHVKSAAETQLVQMPIAAHAHVELEIVVGTIARVGAQHAAFTATIPATEEN